MITPLNSSGTGLGGPGMWDPMPLIPPSSPPAQAKEPQFVWSRPAQAAPDEKKEAAGTGKKPTARTPAKKKAVKKKAAKKTVKKKTAKKKPLKKKTAGRAKKRR